MTVELQRVLREEKWKHKHPSDERVVGVAVDMIKEYGFNMAMDFAHMRMADTKHKTRPLSFGEHFWQRVIAVLHTRKI